MEKMKIVSKNYIGKEATIKFDKSEKWLIVDILRKVYGDELSDEQLYEYINSCDNWAVTLRGE